MHENDSSGSCAAQNEPDDFVSGSAGVVCGVEAPETELEIFAAHGVEDTSVPAASGWSEKAGFADA